jgi:hypothetical protein
MEEIIEQLKNKKNELEAQIEKIDKIINFIEDTYKEETPIEQSRKEEKLCDLIPKVKAPEWKKNFNKKEIKRNRKSGWKKGIWTEEIFGFIKNNLNKTNNELSEEIEKEFGIKFTPKAIACQMSVHNIKRDHSLVRETLKKTNGKNQSNKKMTPEIDAFIREIASEMGNKELVEKIEEKFGVKFSKDTIKIYKVKNKIQGCGIGKANKKQKVESEEELIDADFTDEELDEIKHGKKKEKTPFEFPEIENYVLKSKKTDPYSLRDDIIEKFEKDIPLAQVRNLISKRLNKVEGKSEIDRIKKLQEKYEPEESEDEFLEDEL